MSQLLVTADDRTGALEIGGIVANAEFSVNVGTEFDDGPCSVIDDTVSGVRHHDQSSDSSRSAPVSQNGFGVTWKLATRNTSNS